LAQIKPVELTGMKTPVATHCSSTAAPRLPQMVPPLLLLVLGKALTLQ
jgi:hypothetical protein